jgi:hypothetical protein
MNLHPNTTLTTAVLVIASALMNIGMAYFNITGQISCDLTAAAPQMQAAAAAAIGK